jgi:hypothetical protein
MTERIVALAMLLASGVYLTQALRLPLGAAARPGPGFYPVAIGAFACAVALVITAVAFRGMRRDAGAEPPEPSAGERRHVGLAVATLAGFCLLLPWIGYPLAALLFVGILLRELGAGWRTSVLAALVSAEASYYLFAILLGVTLPRGFWPH